MCDLISTCRSRLQATYGKPYCEKKPHFKCDKNLSDSEHHSSHAGKAVFLNAAVVRCQEAEAIMQSQWALTEDKDVEPATTAENKMARRVFEVHVLSHLVLGQHDMAIKAFEKSTKIRTMRHQDHTHLLGLIHDRSARDAMWSSLEKLYKHVMLHIWEGSGTFPIEYLSEMPVVAQWAAKRNLERLTKHKSLLIEPKAIPRGPLLPASRRLTIAVVSGHGFASRGSTTALMASLAHRDQNTMSIRCFDGSAPDPLGQVVGVTNRQCDLIENVYNLDTDEFAARVSKEQVHILLFVNGATPGKSKWEGLLKLRPAPIQATATWGVTSVDFFATDAIRAPPEYANHHTSKLMHVPTHPFLCMRPPIKTEEPRSGWVALAYMGSPRNLERETWNAWMRAMQIGKRSRILLPNIRRDITQKRGGLKAESQIEREAGLYAIEHARMSFAEEDPETADIILDPMTPGMETVAPLEALARSLPIVTSPGEAPESREAAGVVSAMSRSEGVVRGSDDYSEVLGKMIKLIGGVKGVKWRRTLSLSYFGKQQGAKKRIPTPEEKKRDQRGRCGEYSKGMGVGSRMAWDVFQAMGAMKMNLLVNRERLEPEVTSA